MPARPPARPSYRAGPVAAALVAGILAVLTACGGDAENDTVVTDSAQVLPTQPGDSGAGSATVEPTGQAGDVQTLTVTLEDGGLTMPEALAAGPYEILVENAGGLDHDLSVEHDGESVGTTGPIPAGLSETLTVTLEPGEYTFFSSVGGDRQDGMELTVAVE